MKPTRLMLALAAASALSGCAGMHTVWQLQLEMHYVTPDKVDTTPAAPSATPPASAPTSTPV